MLKETPKKITSLHHPLVKHWVKIRENKNYRETSQSALVAGKKLVEELSCITRPSRVLATEISTTLSIKPTHLVTFEILKKVTGLVSPEAIAAEFPLPEPTPLDGKSFLLVLDHISDPGNMGTLARTALALGWEGLILLPGCVDLFNEKVIRASRGACFKLPFQFRQWEEIAEMAEKNQAPLFLADVKGAPLNTLPRPISKAFLILGNEAKGVSPCAHARAKGLTIPMPGPMESLNVAIAGGILMYQLKELSA